MTSKPPLIDFDSNSASTPPSLMLGLGLAIAFAAIGMTAILPRDTTPTDTLTPGAVRLMAAIFLSVAALGAVLAGVAARALRRDRAYTGALAAGSPDAWRLDRDWTPGRSSDGIRAAGLRAAVKAACGSVTVFLVVINISMALNQDPSTNAPILPVGFMIGAVILYAMFGPAIAKAFSQGDSTLSWDGPSPIRLGTDWIGRAEVSARLEAPRAWLRFVVEKPVADSDYGMVARREAEHVPVSIAASPRAGGGTAVILRFKTEADAPASAWCRSPSRYWELVLEDEKAGFSTAFPLPLY